MLNVPAEDVIELAAYHPRPQPTIDEAEAIFCYLCSCFLILNPFTFNTFTHPILPPYFAALTVVLGLLRGMRPYETLDNPVQQRQVPAELRARVFSMA